MVLSLRDPGKVILKLVFLALALAFIFSRVFNQDHLTSLEYTVNASFFFEHIEWLFLEVLLLMINLFCESLKWKYVMAGTCHLSKRDSLKAVVAGFTSGMFTPNRTGEFVGRVIMLPAHARINGVIGSAILSALQLLCTIVFGIIGLLFLKDHAGFMEMLPSARVFIWSLVLLLSVLTLIFMIFRGPLSRKFQFLYEAFLSFRKSSLLFLASLSVMRYVVFSLQFVLALLLFGISYNLGDLFCGVAVFFLLSSAVPSFLLSEIITRGAVAVLIFNSLGLPDVTVFLASTFIWTLNIALPSLAGAFVLTLRKE